MLNYISAITIPLIIIIIVANGIIKRAAIFELFTEGAKEGLITSIKILPSLIGLIVAISMLRASGVFDFFSSLISPLLSKTGFPTELVPLAIIRPISGSASLAAVRDILNNYGADSFVGRCASVMMGSTETTFYTLAIYFGCVKITNSRYTIRSALSADLIGIIASVVFVSLFFN